MATISRERYAEMYGPTKGDGLRLGDTALVAEIEHDHAVYGEECLHGGGKTLRDGIGLAAGLTSAQGALDMLWADELRTLCHELRFGVGPRTTMSQCLSVLRWNATGKELTRGVCRALRRRNCIEADDPVFDKVGDLL